MTPLDLGLTVAGGLASALRRAVGGSRRATWLVVLGLVAVSAIPTFLIGSSQRPTDVSFEDVRLDRIPAMTSWVRLEGDLRQFPGATTDLYELHDTRDDRVYVIVIAPAPLTLGHAVVTGRISPRASAVGNVGSLDADVPAVPRRDEPFHLILLPAAIGGVIVLGTRIGYPVVRRERQSGKRAARLPVGERLATRWSGRIGSEVVKVGEARPATICGQRRRQPGRRLHQ